MRDKIKIDKLSSFCKVIAGQSPKGSAYNENGIGVEFHQGKKAFGLHTIQPSNVWTTEITKLAQPGDILMSVRAPVGPTNFTDREVCIGRGLAAIRCKPEVLPQYILYVLKSIESKIVGKDGAVFNSISKDMIEDLPVPAVDKVEQQRIVDILDREFAKIDALKANAEKSLQAAKDLFQATLKKELEPKEGWSIKPFGEICDIFDKKRKPISKRDREPGPYPYYGASCIQDYVKDYLFDGRYLLIGEDGAKWGPGDDTAYIVEGKFWVNNHAHIVKAKEGFLDDYLRYFIKQLDLNPLVAGAIIPKLTQEKLVAIEIPVPPLGLQQEIVSNLDDLNDKCNTLQENYQKTLTLCDDLKQALLRKAFNGEL